MGRVADSLNPRSGSTINFSALLFRRAVEPQTAADFLSRATLRMRRMLGDRLEGVLRTQLCLPGKQTCDAMLAADDWMSQCFGVPPQVKHESEEQLWRSSSRKVRIGVPCLLQSILVEPYSPKKGNGRRAPIAGGPSSAAPKRKENLSARCSSQPVLSLLAIHLPPGKGLGGTERM